MNHGLLILALDFQSDNGCAVFAERYILVRKRRAVLREQNRSDSFTAADGRNEHVVFAALRIILAQNFLEFLTEQVDLCFGELQQIAIVRLRNFFKAQFVDIGGGVVLRVRIAHAEHTPLRIDDIRIGVDQLAHNPAQIRIREAACRTLTEYPVHFSDFF